MMKLVKWTFVTMLSVISAHSAFAGEAGFSGLSFSLNGSLASTNIELSDENIQIRSLGESSANGFAQVGFGYTATDKAVFSIGATYRLSDLKAGQISIGDEVAKLSATRSYSIYFEPGLTITDKSMVYALVSYEGARGVGQVTSLSTTDKSMVYALVFSAGRSRRCPPQRPSKTEKISMVSDLGLELGHF
jgi:hypothetical protein